MKAFCRRLQELLEGQAGLMAELIELGRAETEALKANDVQALAGLVARQDECAARLQELEKRRLAVQDELEGRLAPAAKGLPLSQMLAQICPEGASLVVLEEQPRRSFLELRELNETNRLLIRQALAFANIMLASLAPQLVYDREGRVDLPGPRGLVDQTV